MSDTSYVADEKHYSLVVERMQNEKKHLWICTNDIKDLVKCVVEQFDSLWIGK